jgi:hypothetical protein
MAAGSQDEKGTCALLVQADKIKIIIKPPLKTLVSKE